MPRVKVAVLLTPVPPFAAGTTEKLAVGDPPAPPPSIKSPVGSSAEEAHVDVPEKYGTPPLMPATVNAGVVVELATEISPPVKPTLVTVPDPPPLIVLQPNPVPEVQIRAFVAPEQDGIARPEGTVAVNAPSTVLAERAARSA